VMPGKCFRRDTPDARHLPVFHQIEGLVIDRGITFADLPGTIETFTTAYFGPDIDSRLRPAYFPFTEPSAEYEITCTICRGSGCRTCSGTGWIELGGCGMVDPAVFAAVGIDASGWAGFAFRFGIVRTPLSWLRDFAPFQTDVATIAAALDDLGLVVESIERVGEGLGEGSVARVVEIGAIAGADRIRRVGGVLPGGLEIAGRTMRGVVSNGMLCSGRELALSEDGDGLLILTEVEGAAPGQPLTEALGIEPDVIFDITVEGNRPDAWCIAGIARDLAARLGVPFALPAPPAGASDGGAPAGAAVGALASAVVESPELCPRLTV